jgi:hypothetical protein
MHETPELHGACVAEIDTFGFIMTFTQLQKVTVRPSSGRSRAANRPRLLASSSFDNSYHQEAR